MVFGYFASGHLLAVNAIATRPPASVESPIQNKLYGKLSWRWLHLKRIEFTDYSRLSAGEKDRDGKWWRHRELACRETWTGLQSERLLEVDPAIIGLEAKLRALELQNNTLLTNPLEYQSRRKLVALFIHRAI